MTINARMQALIQKLEAEDAAHFAELRQKGKAQADAREKARAVTREKKLVNLRAAREARAAKLKRLT
jgi:hypothetical protein